MYVYVYVIQYQLINAIIHIHTQKDKIVFLSSIYKLAGCLFVVSNPTLRYETDMLQVADGIV